MDISVHDNRIKSYSVFSYTREIIIHTEYKEIEPFENIDILFSDVVIYHFESDNFNNIIFDIVEEELEHTLKQYDCLFAKLKNHGWLEFQYESEQDLIIKLKQLKVKSFVIQSSNGLNGFVWAKKMEIKYN